jgi:uncharacterized membrane protein YdjX (TVP38/TMEM64 family)
VRGRRRPLPRLRLADLPWRELASYALILGALSLVIYSRIDMEQVHREAARLNGGVVFGVLLVLPLLGFPVTPLHVAAGIRFGATTGLLLVSLSILLQVAASFFIVRFWRRRFERARWVKRIRERIPEGAHASVCIFTVLLPGVPYAAVNYTLALIGVPLRILLFCAWPLHTLRSTVTVIFGDQSDRLTAARLAVLLVYALLIVGASWWTYRRLHSQLEGPPPMAGGRRKSA